MELTVYRRGEPIVFESDLTEGQAAGILREDLRKAPNEFKSSLLSSYEGRGLSPKQSAWFIYLAQEILDKENDELMERFGPYKAIVDMFNGVDLARFQLRTEGVVLSKPKADSKNAGMVYVKDSRGGYLGKIDKLGRYIFSSYGSMEEREAINYLDAIAADPVGAAIRYGRETNNCSCCGRTLSDEVSVFGGIGPICLSRLAGPDARKEMERSYKAGDSNGLIERLRKYAFHIGAKAASSPSPAASAAAEIDRSDYESETDYNLARAISLL